MSRREHAMRIAEPLLFAMMIGGAMAAAGQTIGPRAPMAVDEPAMPSRIPSIRITAPLGRTGLVTRLRIVAQVQAPAQTTMAPIRFLVDGQIVGSVVNGPPYAVEWTDENPFERREIVAEADGPAGTIVRDTVVLPPFEITDQSDVASVLLETGVYDKGGRFVPNLNPSAFVVRENGTPQTIDLVSQETLPTTVALLVDNSQSMARRMDFVRRAAERLAAGLRRGDRMVVVPFNARIGAMTGPTDNSATIGEAIAAMRASGGTAILDSLLESIRTLEGLDGRRVAILVTDGYDENSASRLDDVLKAAGAAHVTIYAVGIGGVAGISLNGEAMLGRLAEETGGRVFYPPREPDLVSASDAVAADAHSRYLITYTPVDQRKDGTWRGVSVGVPGGYRVRTRAGYFARAPAPIRPAIEFTITTPSRQFVDVVAEDFEVVEDGVVQSVDTFQEAVDPVAIVVALDSSGSMKKSADAVRDAAHEFVLAVRPEDSVALMTFADTPIFAHTLGTNRQRTLEAIDTYDPIGGTALYDAMWNSLLHLESVPGRRAVVVLTDGRDEDNPGRAPGSVHTLDEVLDLDRTAEALVFPIGLGSRVERRVLERLAAESGGEAHFPSDVSLLGDQFRRIVENLRRRYVVSYTSTNSAHDGGWRQVEIRPKAGRLVVMTRGGYVAPDR